MVWTQPIFAVHTQFLKAFQSGKEVQNAGLSHSSGFSATAAQIYNEIMTGWKEQAVGRGPTSFTVAMCQRCLDQAALQVSISVKVFRPVFTVVFHARSFGAQMKGCSCQVGATD